ncbi:zf-HC2 domain-containing protein [Frankia sp. CNm7]|uniref:Zf-HC2 domain-containing protein n=1 Tax=Frankia nepalensis TaxID=1836974 RepID=A0A937RGK7_9ACTN|nr:zf-HC2 domain-containing protein [Frankia nepalensis]MBL7501381.1 zf-HC2 domain-containing protein [Frankia nepalensis]MBL7511908.1 zf-HC2 domain-containing protein [Frankia nepalensis]MBL7518537.1 zf-HC2 domain-containing protein [Frankia nepalensis]MBL7628489.1 zf-HC2 domain-containing protein [Frankia nepalensis]
MTSHLGDRLCPLVDGQLRHDERDHALAHLAHCASCRAEVAEYRRMKQRLAGLREPALPDSLADRLLGLGAARPGPGGLANLPGAARLARPGGAPPGAASRHGAVTRQRLPLAGAARAVAFGPSPRPEPPGLPPDRPSPGFSPDPGFLPDRLRRSGRSAGRAGAAAARPRLVAPPGRPGWSVAVVAVVAEPVFPPRALAPAVPPGPAAGFAPDRRSRSDRPGSRSGRAAGRPAIGEIRLAGGPAPGRPARTARSRRGARVRRTLIGSAALMLLTVTGAAIGDQPRGGTTAVRPAAPATQLPTNNGGGTTPLVSTVSFATRR